MKVRTDELLASVPPEWPQAMLPEIRSTVEASGAKIVVIDDDPTGTQTVYDVPVLTEWSLGSLTMALAEPSPILFILTNSRSLPLPSACAVNQEIAFNLNAAGKATRRDFVVVSRSDSTLRGHYPGEVEALIEGLGRKIDGVLIVPFFLEGGRFTVEDVHYVAEGEHLVPAAETEFARDAAFGYQSSDLRAWVSEKHHGGIGLRDVASISLADLRVGGPEAVATALNQLRDERACVVNAISYRDIEVFVAGLLHAEKAGRHFIYRTAASFVRVRGGLAHRAPLTDVDLERFLRANGRKSGLIIAGSHVQKSTSQIETVRSLPGIASIEVSVVEVLDPTRREAEVKRAATLAGESLASGKDTLVYTSRQLITGTDEESSLHIGQRVSAALVEVVDALTERPSWLIAKGGITSSDIATRSLHMKRAEVLGQALSGVPVWRAGTESRWPELIYVIFPGNVGGIDAIAEVIHKLRGF